MSTPSRPLRILFLNYEFPPIGGGSGTGSRYLARELARQGQDVEIVTSWFRGLRRDFRQGRLRLRRLRVLRARAGQCRPHEMATYIAVSFLYLLLRRAPRPEVMVSFHSIPSGVPAWPLSVLWRVPHVVLFRGGDVPGFLPRDLEKLHARTLWLNRLIVHQAAAAAANSDGLAGLARRAFPGREIGVISNGVDTRVFAPPPGGRSGRPEVTVAFAGRLTNQKGLDTLLEALGRVRREQPSLRWRAVVAGDGPILETLEALARALGIADRVTFPGWLSREQMPAFFHDADLLAFPSRFEGMPNTVLEAMASGLPIVGTRVMGTEELVEEGASGHLVEIDDVAGLAARLRGVISDEGLRLAMGARGRAIVRERYSWTSRARQLLDVCNDVVAARRP